VARSRFASNSLFLKDLAGNNPDSRRKPQAKSLIYKHFTSKSLFLKDLGEANR